MARRLSSPTSSSTRPQNKKQFILYLADEWAHLTSAHSHRAAAAAQASTGIPKTKAWLVLCDPGPSLTQRDHRWCGRCCFVSQCHRAPWEVRTHQRTTLRQRLETALPTCQHHPLQRSSRKIAVPRRSF